jgi:protein-disulfide isomerase
MKHVSWILALCVGFLGGVVVGGALDWPHWGSKTQAPTAVAPAAPSQQAPARPARPPDDKTVFRAPIDGSPVRGPADALVTVVIISDFQCPYCKRVVPTLDQLAKDYAGKIRFVFKHNPLPFHPLAPGAAQAAEAARAQGGDAKFWAMHDQLFEQSPQLEQANLESAAQKLGLDLGKFKAALAAGAAKDRIAKDQALAAQLGATGTPAFFINGRKLVGAQPVESFKALVDEELAKAEALVKSGTPAAGVYEAIIAKGVTAPPAAPGGEGQQRPAPATVYRKVDLRKDDPARGAADAPVTVVMFSDFQCPFCSRVEPTLKQLEESYKGKVRIVWKHLPLGMHPNALPAALAAEAAREQGKFWEMHDKLFADQSKLDAATFEKYARDLGLNLDRFKAAVAGKKFQDRISADQQLASSAGANGTPTMFFNCRQLVGAVPFDMMKSTMDEELKKADGLLKGKKAGADFYEKACAANLALAGKEPAAKPAAEAQPAAPAPAVDVKALGLRADDPVRGNAKAPVTLVLFSDFQCPFCSRVETSITEVEKTYGNKVKVVWKHQPLPFHPNAKPAAEAAEAAREQGKFWEMHDKLFADQQGLSPAKYEQYAKELGLNVAKFQEAQKSGRGAKRIEEDQAVAAKVGVDGTPTMFVNGERIVGAVPFEQIKAVIDRKLSGGK